MNQATTAGLFTVEAPNIDSYFLIAAGLDAMVTIKESGFGDFLKISEATQFRLHPHAHNSQPYQLGQNASRTQVLIIGYGSNHFLDGQTDPDKSSGTSHIRHWASRGIQTELSEGNVMVQGGSWDCFRMEPVADSKQWLNFIAGELTILHRGLPAQDLFMGGNKEKKSFVSG